jgi:hypothetical protein
MPGRRQAQRHQGTQHVGEHSGQHAKPAYQRPARRYGWLTAVVAITMACAGVVTALHAASLLNGTAALSSQAAANCGASPALAADTTTDTALGVNATSTSQLSGATAAFGHLSAIRVYYTGMPDPNAWTTGAPGVNNSAVVLSFRVPPATILSGTDDKALAHFFDTAPTGHPIYWTYYHEPEPFITDGQFTLAQYKAAWTHIAAIADAAHNADLKATLILMSWDLDPRSGFHFQDFLPAGHVISVLAWDAYPAGTVHDEDPQPTAPADFMGPAEAASRSVGLPFGFAEFALGTATDRPQWLAEVAAYLRSTGALFGTLFNSTGFPWMELNDQPSISAWRKAVSGSGAGAPPPVASPSPAPPKPSPTASKPTTSPSPSVTPAPPTPPALTVPVITGQSVSPGSFAPTGSNHVRIMYKLSLTANVSVCVLSNQGTVLRELDSTGQAAGWASIWYFGYDSSWHLLPPGTYPVLIVASNAAGTATARTTVTISS